MEKPFVYLASASPRRCELLRQIDVAYELCPATIDETRCDGEAPTAYVTRVAILKANAAWNVLEGKEAPRRPVVAADTAVVLGASVLGKPGTRERALEMLEKLSGRTHDVLTAVAVRFGDKTDTALSENKVRFRSTTADERSAYCDSLEPLDKAGGYGIQGLGAVFVESLRGSYSGVMGLPLFETASLLKRHGLPIWLEAPEAGS